MPWFSALVCSFPRLSCRPQRIWRFSCLGQFAHARITCCPTTWREGRASRRFSFFAFQCAGSIQLGFQVLCSLNPASVAFNKQARQRPFLDQIADAFSTFERIFNPAILEALRISTGFITATQRYIDVIVLAPFDNHALHRILVETFWHGGRTSRVCTSSFACVGTTSPTLKRDTEVF
jgi:hypothetical protein